MRECATAAVLDKAGYVVGMIATPDRFISVHVAVDEGSDFFLTEPEAHFWARQYVIDLLPAKDRSEDQRKLLHSNYVNNQLAKFEEFYEPLFVATSKNMEGRRFLGMFGKGWPKNWKTTARAIRHTFTVISNPAYEALRGYEASLPAPENEDIERYLLGVIYLTTKVNFVSLAQKRDAEEAEATAALFDPNKDGVHRVYTAEDLRPTNCFVQDPNAPTLYTPDPAQRPHTFLTAPKNPRHSIFDKTPKGKLF